MTRTPNKTFHTPLAAVTTAGSHNPIDVSDYETIAVQLEASGGSVDMTVAFKGSIAGESPAFSSAAAAITNPWAKLAFTELTTSTETSGATDIALSGAGVTLYEIEAKALKWFGVDVTAHTAGTLTVRVFAKGT